MKNKLTGALLTAALVLCFSATARSADPRTLSESIIPKPVEQVFHEGEFVMSPATAVVTEGDVDEYLCRYMRGFLYKSYPGALDKDWKTTTVKMVMPAGRELPAEGYVLTVTPDEVTIAANERAGIFYGIQTLLQMLPAEVQAGKAVGGASVIPCQQVTDYPRFAFRGAHLDVSRTFSDKERVLRYIDNMASHKLNYFHWHLTDDEGWRIELKSYPELATVGGFRGGDSPVQPIYGEWDKKYGGYFTQDDIKEVIEYAALRNVEVIPEIDLPGHSRTAAKVFPHILCGNGPDAKPTPADRREVWCASKEANYQMLEKILDEVCALFPSQYFHLGGDEVSASQWEKCADCKRLMAQKGYTKANQLEDYFMARVIKVVEKNGKTPCVWNEAAARGQLSKNAAVWGWENIDKCRDVISKGYKTVVMPGSYFYVDHRQAPAEDGMTWAGLVSLERLYSFNFAQLGFTPAQMEKVWGMETTFFAELFLSHTPDYLDYMTYPRISALSEVAWTDEKDRDWESFYGRLTSAHLDRLAAMGIAYRLFPPQTDYKSGMVTAQAPFEGAEVRYTDDGSVPTAESPLYKGAIKDLVPERYLFRTFYNGMESPAVVPSGKFPGRVAASGTTTIDIPISEILSTDGTWYLVINTPEDNLKLEKITIQAGAATTTVIGGRQNVSPLHRIRVRATAENRKGVMHVTIKNNNNFPCDMTFEFERSPYIEPAVTMTSSMGASEKFPFKNAVDYNNSSYSRTTRTCRKGDDITFTFAKPVDAFSIYVRTGLSYMPRYHIPAGRVLVSADGVKFTEAGTLHAGNATVFPKGTVKAVRIVSDSDGNSENAVAIQDLRIKPRR